MADSTHFTVFLSPTLREQARRAIEARAKKLATPHEFTHFLPPLPPRSAVRTKTLDPTIYGLAEYLAADLPAVLAPARREWVEGLAQRLQEAFENWAEDADIAVENGQAR